MRTNDEFGIQRRNCVMHTRNCVLKKMMDFAGEPGILEWPNMIKANRETHFPAYVSDCELLHM